MDLPILCTLTESELRERRQMILSSIRETAIDVIPLPDGYAYRFSPNSEVLFQLSRLVDLERQCCRFLTFKIVVEVGEQPIRLEVTGPPEARPVIEDLFGP
jgi:hypothetical protein